MKKLNQSTKGFTLVEIMIVVVIIGLLAAMAIPAFQKVRRASVKSTMANDGRQLSAAANQYFLENNVTTVALGALLDTAATGTSAVYLKSLSKGVTTAAATLGQNGNFTLSHPNFGDLNIDVDTGKTQSETLK